MVMGNLSTLPETVRSVCTEWTCGMDTSDEPRTVHFQSPASLVERLDAIANLFDKDRTELIVKAIREYVEDTADSATVQGLVATKYYDDQLEYETVKQVVGADTAKRLRLLKADLEDGSLDIAAPADIGVYEGDTTTGDDEVRQLYERYRAAESKAKRREIVLEMGKLDRRRHAEIYAALEDE